MSVQQWLRQQWDRVGAWVLIGLGAVVLLFGWLGMSKTAYAAEQLPYILSGGIFGLFLLGLGAMLWLSADLKDEWRKLDRIEEALTRDDRRAPAAPPAPADGDGTAAGAATPPRLASLRQVGQ